MSTRNFQHCYVCGKKKPLKPEYFDFRNVEKQEFHSECRRCRYKKSMQEKIKEDPDHPLTPIEDQYLADKERQLEQQRRLLAAEKWQLVKAGMWELGLGKFEQALSQYSQGASIPHAAELVESMTAVFGGPMGVAGQLASLFYDPETKQSDRIRIMELYTRCVLKNTEMGGARKPIELLSDEDLEREKERTTKILNLQAARDAKEVA